MSRFTNSGRKLLLALYGPRLRGERTGVLTRWWNQQEHFLQELGLEITHICGQFAEKPRRMNNSVTYTYRRYRRRFEEELTRGNLEGLDLEAMNSRPDGYLAFDWDALCTIGEERERARGVSEAIGVDMHYAGKLGDNLVARLRAGIKNAVSSFVEARYGLCTVMPQDFMPIGYTAGLMASKAPDMLITEASEWMKWLWRECAEYLRNVHALNVVNDSHLQLPVGEKRLGDWIRVRPERGSLAGLGNGLTLWSLVGDNPSADELSWDAPRVQAVREELMRQDFFPWQKELR